MSIAYAAENLPVPGGGWESGLRCCGLVRIAINRKGLSVTSYVPAACLSIRFLAWLAYGTFVVSTVALIVAIVEDSPRCFGVGLALGFAATWVDRWRAARVIQARYGRLVSLWQADVAALEAGERRPDLRLLEVPPERPRSWR